eukprot:Gb_17536 [translate_table: standard]
MLAILAACLAGALAVLAIEAAVLLIFIRSLVRRGRARIPNEQAPASETNQFLTSLLSKQIVIQREYKTVLYVAIAKCRVVQPGCIDNRSHQATELKALNIFDQLHAVLNNLASDHLILPMAFTAGHFVAFIKAQSIDQMMP